MHILVVGNVLKDVYLNLDSRTEKFEPDANGTEWLDFSFDASKHHYFNRTSSFGGAAITLEVLQKMGLKADITDTSFHFDKTGPVVNGPTGVYRYILTADNGVTYMVPSAEQKTPFTTPEKDVDFLFIDRSSHLTPGTVDKITAYLDYSRKTKLVLYLKESEAENLAGLISRADLIFLEGHKTQSEAYNRGEPEKSYAPTLNLSEGALRALKDFPEEKVIWVSENDLRYLDFSERISVSRIDRLTHLSAYSIIAATVLGGFILGKTVEYALKMARINVENATLDSTLSLEELENIATSTSESNLELITKTLMTPGKGILAMDESGGNIHKKFEELGISDTAKTRHDYREILLTTPRIEKYITGVILFDETARDKMGGYGDVKSDDTGAGLNTDAELKTGAELSDGAGLNAGIKVPDFLISHGIVPGIKVDAGLSDITQDLNIEGAAPGESYTKGINDLAARLRVYYQMGLRFSKWRAAFLITLDSDGNILTPTTAAIRENCRLLAEYAASCQSAGLVPIVEPEVVYAGDFSLEQCAGVTRRVLDELFKALTRHGVNLKACILKTNMVTSGAEHYSQASPEEVGRETARVLRASVPSNLGGVVFLSGGQTPEQATVNLAAVVRRGPFAWPVSFSFSRAVQGPALNAWNGDNANADLAQEELLQRLEANVEALKKG